jgi:hypothetical protein
MTTASDIDTFSTLSIRKDLLIDARLEASFSAVLAEMGPESQMPGGEPFPMVLEPWPGGRWFRDLGNNTGHLWGHVQVIKPPTLLEVCGPMFMSYPAVSHVQFRLAEDGPRTRLSLTHRAMGLIADEHREGVSQGWDFMVERIREIARRSPRISPESASRGRTAR